MNEFKYEGTDTLENLKEAVNYNLSLASLVKKNATDGEILDFGAGIGTFPDLIDLKSRSTCLEIDPTQADILRSKGHTVTNSISKEKYDFIYSLNVLEHIKDDKLQVEKLINGLRPKGKLLIFVPAFNYLFSSLDKKVGHFRRYNAKSLKNLFIEMDVEIEKVHYFDTIGFFFALFFKLLRLDSSNVNKRNITIFDKFFFPLNKKLDPIFSRLFGKNVYILVKKKS